MAPTWAVPGLFRLPVRFDIGFIFERLLFTYDVQNPHIYITAGELSFVEYPKRQKHGDGDKFRRSKYYASLSRHQNFIQSNSSKMNTAQAAN